MVSVACYYNTTMAKNKNVSTALHHFCIHINEHNAAAAIIKLLLEVGDANVLLSTKNRYHGGDTLLQRAHYIGASDEIKILLTTPSNSKSSNSTNSSSFATAVPLQLHNQT